MRRAVHRICGVDRDDMFVHVILVHTVEMTVVKIIHMAVVANRRVSAFGAMAMSMVGMVFIGACGHWRCSLPALWLPIDAPPFHPIVA